MTRQDWIDAALDALTSEGIARVKVAVLAERLEVARSSFYWYFSGRPDLDAALLEIWAQRNVSSIVERCTVAAPTVTAAVLALFECWADPALFDHRLEFAVRAWARGDVAVRERLDEADRRRINAIAALHRRYGDDPTTALVRARIQYHSQIGMYALGATESTAQRLRLVATYVDLFTGVKASDDELAAFAKRVRRLARSATGSAPRVGSSESSEHVWADPVH